MIRTAIHAKCLLRSTALILAISLSGCGGGGDDGNGTTVGSNSPSTTPVSAPASNPAGAGGTTPSSSDPSSAVNPANPGGLANTPPPSAFAGKSAKRGIAYDLANPLDLAVLAPGVSWWYNWSLQPNAQVSGDYRAQYQMDFYPMLWNGNYDAVKVEGFLKQNPQIKYLLVMNEPNQIDQSNLTPQQAANLWPGFEAIAVDTGVKIVGPAISWGNMPGYSDPVVWLDAFYAAYRGANGNRDPQIDYLAFHWYDYGLAAQLDRLAKYGKPFWITEFANWHAQIDGAQIDSLAKQEAQMTEMVAICEARTDVFRYAWFTGRWNNDSHFTSLLGASGQLTDLGKLYLTLPF